MFWKRLLSGIFLVLGAFVLILLGDIWMVAAVAVLSLAGIYELLRVFGLEKHPLSFVVYAGTVVFDALFLYRNVVYEMWMLGLLSFVFVVLLAVYVIRYPKDTIDEVAKCAFSFVYITVLMSFLYQTRCLYMGNWLVWLIFIGSWGSDTCAYVIGKLMGKHHFSELSPKKTIEGCVGGIAGAALIGFGYAFFFPEQNLFMYSPKIVFPIVVAVSALVSQVGDLAASAIKRNYEIKDYGNVIPGHGGILDRFDSVLFVAPFVYYLLMLFATIEVYVS